LVSPELLSKHLQGSERLAKAYALLVSDREPQGLLKMANVMAMGRLKYNDHGPVHSRIVAGSALEILGCSSRRESSRRSWPTEWAT